MNFKNMNVSKLKKEILVQSDSVTCINCCKYYSVPTTASCGHSLCKGCWLARQTCPFCALTVEKKALRLNEPLQIRTDHFVSLQNAFESLYNINSPPTLPCSQFTEGTVQPLNQITSHVQIHTNNPKEKGPEINTIHLTRTKHYQQEDWDKIEVMPEIERNENPQGTVDLEMFDFVDDKNKTQYSAHNPRRSSRKKDFSQGNVNKNLDNKLSKVGKNWQNVKKTKKGLKEKLNNKNNNLNISIEMLKRIKYANKSGPPKIQQLSSDIDDNTPGNADEIITKHTIFNHNNQMNTEFSKDLSLIDRSANKNNILTKVQNNSSFLNVQKQKQMDIEMHNEVEKNIRIDDDKTSKVNFFKRGPLNVMEVRTFNNEPVTNNFTNVKNDADTIEIILKIGETVTNICIQKKDNDVKVNYKSDRAIQTSLGTSDIEHKHDVLNTVENDNVNVQSNDKNNVIDCISSIEQIEKSQSNKINTASADTVSAKVIISDSEDKEHEDRSINVSLKERNENVFQKSGNIVNSNCQAQLSLETIPEDADFSADLDIFDCDSVKEGNVQSLKSTVKTPSVIIMPTSKCNSSSSGKKVNKRLRNDTEDILSNKKIKVTLDNDNKKTQKSDSKENIMDTESENINYDALMSQVFANIEADMENIPKTVHSTQLPTQISNTQISNSPRRMKANVKQNKMNKNTNEEANKKCSENVFSLLEREDANSEILKPLDGTRSIKENTVISASSPDEDGMENKETTSETIIDLVELSTPVQDDDDKSVVEETPQKKTSFSKSKISNDLCLNKDLVDVQVSTDKMRSLNKISNVQIPDIESPSMSGDQSTSDVRKSPLETPLTITKFVNKITYKSTPVAKKSLDFGRGNDENDPDETLYPSSVVAANTTQEREFMSKAFEQTLGTQDSCARRQRKATKLCVACTCLSSVEQNAVKQLCLQRNWMFAEKYTKNVTHLVVGVDEENKSQRSVKYVCALAASKWIVTFEWVEKCLQTKAFVNEEPFEALDAVGEPGPRRSRLAKQKLFHGFTFYCMPPFSVMDIDSLKNILEASGGRVVGSPRDLRVTEAPALLLAEPEETQVNRFTYLAMELKIVPVNYEWILNCLGSYTLKPIWDLLLCSASLLPPAVDKWPIELIIPSGE
ncbi:metacaspase-2 isoform X2 [Bicyclus anynana]|uniref:Metacaspase-2 isoform X2 n=1 Tax=Bicyclus anynana TaxID=110368 RepID=A0ABM3LKD5_BICAN|nr:metacaspase-2 isoform X2 [Bicyclus anynana]